MPRCTRGWPAAAERLPVSKRRLFGNASRTIQGSARLIDEPRTKSEGSRSHADPVHPERSGSEEGRCRRDRSTPARKRAKGRTDFDFGRMPEAKVWPLDSDGFLAWQCREALQRALAMWETHRRTARHLARRRCAQEAQGADRRRPRHQRVLRARRARVLFEPGRKGKLRRFAFSVDVVSHEAGHAFLDVIRPDLFDTPYLETNAFHEAFGDCVAILTSLADPEVRAALLKQRSEAVEDELRRDADGIARQRVEGSDAARKRRRRRGAARTSTDGCCRPSCPTTAVPAC